MVWGSVIIYSWLLLWVLGYHGVFLIIIISLGGVSYIISWELYEMWAGDMCRFYEMFNWIEVGNFIMVDGGIISDLLSLILVVIMGWGSFVVLGFVYIEMWEDKEGANFAIELMIFLLFMVILVAGSNLFVFYLGWEGIGLTSLFLINFWSERVRSFKAVFRVFVINKFGDFGVVVGICILAGLLGDVDFWFLEGAVVLLLQQDLAVGWIELVDIISLAFVVGGGVKSVQFGFHIWLIEAMEAPLGASALMHSSTLVVAGIILVIRMNNLINLSNLGVTLCLIWGAWTTLFSAVVACYQYELKVVLAYSTISSMGFIYCLLGLGALYEAVLYLVIHAFIKIFLFLVIGVIMLYCRGCQDVRWMGGLLTFTPVLWVFYVGGSISLGGLPYWSGYYCKSAAWGVLVYFNNTWVGIRLVILLSMIVTYVYLGRLGWLIFMGERRGSSFIYRVYWVAWCTYISLGLLLGVVLYGGSMWYQLCDYINLCGWWIYVGDNINVIFELDYWGWGSLIIVYNSIFYVLCLSGVKLK